MKSIDVIALLTAGCIGRRAAIHQEPEMSEEQFQRLMDEALVKCRILPTTTVEQIAVMCAMFSTNAVEVYARVETVNGKPVAYLVRKSVQEAIPAFLRRQAS